jgi:hypothetical protein
LPFWEFNFFQEIYIKDVGLQMNLSKTLMETGAGQLMKLSKTLVEDSTSVPQVLIAMVY